MTAIASMITMTPVAMKMFGQVALALAPKMASTDGPRTTAPAMLPTRLAAIISQPVRNPR